MGFYKVWLIVSCIALAAVKMVSCTTVYEALGKHRDLSKFHEMVNRDEVLRKLLQYWPVTVFAPTDEAIDRNNEWILGRENKVVSYHVLNLVAEKTSFPFTSVTSLSGSPPLYMGLKEGPGGRAEYFVNNAKITRSEELASQENSKQLLYVIDEILVPYVSSTSLPPTAFQLLDQPELYDIREPLRQTFIMD